MNSNENIDKVFLENHAKSGNWKGINPSKIDISMVNNPQYGGGNLLHVAAHAARLGKFPQSLITKEGLEKESNLQENVFHIAAGRSELGAIPKRFFSHQNMTKRNTDGNTPIHYAALRGGLNGIPKKFLTRENLLIPNKTGRTPLDFAIFGLKGYGFNFDKADKRTIELETNIRKILEILTPKDLSQLLSRKPHDIYDKKRDEYIRRELLRRKIVKHSEHNHIEI